VLRQVGLQQSLVIRAIWVTHSEGRSTETLFCSRGQENVARTCDVQASPTSVGECVETSADEKTMTHTRLYGGTLDGLEVPAGEGILQLRLEEVSGRVAVYRMQGARCAYLGMALLASAPIQG
jgi:hypothetical protein